MSSKPLVSVVTPFLNAEEFIREAIESVLAQTYDNWELLLVDDGSADASTEIALRYAKQYAPHVRYMEHSYHRNRGVSASRNIGINNAKGEYVAFIDADDVWFPQKLVIQVANLTSQSEASMVYGPVRRWYSWTGNSQDRELDSIGELGVAPNTLVEPPLLLKLWLRNEGVVPSPSGILVRRETIRHIGGFEETFKVMYEDQAFYAKMCLEFPVFVSGECLYLRRKHPHSAVSVAMANGHYHTYRLFFLRWLTNYLVEKGNEDAHVWRAVRRELWPYRHPILNHVLGPAFHFLRRRNWLTSRM